MLLNKSIFRSLLTRGGLRIGWIARMPIIKMPARLLEGEVMRILESAVRAWSEVLDDERKTAGMRVKWRLHRKAKVWCHWTQRYREHKEGYARLEIFGAKLLLGCRLGEWNALAQAAALVWRRQYELLSMRRIVNTMRERVQKKRRIAQFADRWLFNHTGLFCS